MAPFTRLILSLEVKHFVARHREAETRKKRGGGVARLSLEVDSPESPVLYVAEDARLSPDAAFDCQWAVTVLSLEAVCVAG